MKLRELLSVMESGEKITLRIGDEVIETYQDDVLETSTYYIDFEVLSFWKSNVYNSIFIELRR